MNLERIFEKVMRESVVKCKYCGKEVELYDGMSPPWIELQLCRECWAEQLRQQHPEYFESADVDVDVDVDEDKDQYELWEDAYNDSMEIGARAMGKLNHGLPEYWPKYFADELQDELSRKTNFNLAVFNVLKNTFADTDENYKKFIKNNTKLFKRISSLWDKVRSSGYFEDYESPEDE